jgi:hypothetical protein
MRLKNCQNIREPFVCLVYSHFRPFINALQMCLQRSAIDHLTVSSIGFPLTSEKREIIHQGEPKIDTNFMLDGT